VIQVAKRSKTAIATEREGLLACYYEDEGWINTRVTHKSKWSKGKDFFGIADILSYRDGITMLTDVTSYNSYDKLKIMKNWMLENVGLIPESFRCAVAIWKPKSKQKPERFIIIYIKLGYDEEKVEIEVKDEWYERIKKER